MDELEELQLRGDVRIRKCIWREPHKKGCTLQETGTFVPVPSPGVNQLRGKTRAQFPFGKTDAANRFDDRIV
jgi:hypothetical protein